MTDIVLVASGSELCLKMNGKSPESAFFLSHNWLYEGYNQFLRAVFVLFLLKTASVRSVRSNPL